MSEAKWITTAAAFFLVAPFAVHCLADDAARRTDDYVPTDEECDFLGITNKHKLSGPFQKYV